MFSGTNSRRFPTTCTVIIRAVGMVVDAGTVLRVHRVATFSALQQAAKDVFILSAYKAADGSQLLFLESISLHLRQVSSGTMASCWPVTTTQSFSER